MKTATLKTTIILSAAVVAVLTHGLGLHAVAGTHNTDDCTEEDYAIFSAGLDHLYGKKLDSVFLLDRTSIGIPPGVGAVTYLTGIGQVFSDRVPEEARQTFIFRNKTRARVEPRKLKTSFEVISMQDEIGQTFYARGGWKAFYQEHPKNHDMLVISLPGINREHDRALLYIGHSCGMMCGGGTALFLSKEGGKWLVVDTETLWMT